MPSPSIVVDRVFDMQTTALAYKKAKIYKKFSPCFARCRKLFIAAEQNNGWLEQCADSGRFLAINRELVDTLALTLRQLAGNSLILEVCAGSGILSHLLAARDVHIQATDVNPPQGSKTLSMSAQEALHRFKPSVVLGIFVPHDGGVDEAVLTCPWVQHYVIINARIGGALGSPLLWRAPDWKHEPLDNISRWLITRHDVWLGCDNMDSDAILQHGEAWHLTRTTLSPTAQERLNV